MIKRRRISHIIQSGKVDMFLVQETKLKEISDSLVKIFWGMEDIGYSFSGVDGRSGGLLTIWRDQSVSVIFSFRGNGFLGNKVLLHGGTFYIVIVYSACSLSAKRIPWAHIL